MNSIDQDREKRIDTITNQDLKMPNRLLLAHLEMEPFLDLKHRFIRLELDVRDVRVDHEAEEVKDEVRGLAERGVGREAVLLEGGVLGGFGAAHAVDHFFAELHHRREGFGVAAEDEAEIGVEKAACGGGGSDQYIEKLSRKSGGRGLDLPSGASNRLSRCRSPTPSRYVMTQ